MARAVYSRNKIAILDDVFSQLDASTQINIAEKLLGPDGLLRRWDTTVVMTASSCKRIRFNLSQIVTLLTRLLIARLLAYSDRVIALSQDGKVIQDGTFDTLRKIPGYINDVAEPQVDAAQDSVESPGSGQGNSHSTKLVEPPKAEDAVEAPDPETDDSKPAGTDLSVYRYYFSRINWKNTVIFLIFQVALAVSSAFGCETVSCSVPATCSLTISRCLGQMVDRR